MKIRILLITFFVALFYFEGKTQELDSLNRLINNTDNDLTKVKLLIQKGKIISRTNKNKARIIFKQAEHFAEQNKLYKQQVQANIALGRFYIKTHKYDSAKYLYKKGLSICEQRNIKNEEISCIGEIGKVYFIQSNYPKALKQFHLAIEKLNVNKNDTTKANLLNNIANIYYKTEDFPKAIEYFEQSLIIKEQLGNKVSLSRTYNNIANVYAEQEKLDKALHYYNRSLNLIKERGLTTSLAISYANIAAVYRENEDYEKGLYYGFEALKIDSMLNDSYGVASDYNEIAFSYKGLKQFQKAEFYLNKSLNIIRKINAKDLEINLLRDFSETYSDEGDFKKALEFYKKYVHLKDSIFTETKNKQIVEADKKYEIEKKNSEIQILKLENLRSANRNRIFALLSLFMFAIAVLFIVFYRQRVKTNSILNIKNDELDNLNSTKNRLLRIISHDFKAPITAFYSITNSLKANLDNFSKEEINDKLERILNSSLAMKLQLNNLLTWAISQNRQIEPKLIEINLHILVYKVIFVLEEFAKQKNLAINNNISENTEINTDGKMLAIVLNNLLVNAIKFSKENGTIEINSKTEENYLFLIVKDYGIGMNEEQQKRLFINKERTVKIEGEGTNQGLLISKEMINKLGGEISVKSKLNEGTEITIKLNL